MMMEGASSMSAAGATFANCFQCSRRSLFGSLSIPKVTEGVMDGCLDQLSHRPIRRLAAAACP